MGTRSGRTSVTHDGLESQGRSAAMSHENVPATHRVLGLEESQCAVDVVEVLRMPCGAELRGGSVAAAVLLREVGMRTKTVIY
jgi:hypothetical protein